MRHESRTAASTWQLDKPGPPQNVLRIARLQVCWREMFATKNNIIVVNYMVIDIDPNIKTSQINGLVSPWPISAFLLTCGMQDLQNQRHCHAVEFNCEQYRPILSNNPNAVNQQNIQQHDPHV